MCFAALAALSTGCGGTSTAVSQAPATSATSAASTASAGSPGPAANAALAAVHAACQQTTWKAEMQLKAGMAGQDSVLTTDIAADPRPGRLAAHITSSMGVEEEFVGDTLYARQGSTQWSKLSLASVPADQQHLPCDEFTALSGPGITAVQELGDQTAGSVHHYRFRADAYALLSVALVYSPDPLAAFKNQPVQISADLYTDASGRAVRYETDTADAGGGASGIVSLKLTETYTDYGAPVTVTAPDPSQVSDQPLVPQNATVSPGA
jgi:hypothetical protein